MQSAALMNSHFNVQFGRIDNLLPKAGGKQYMYLYMSQSDIK